jgi:hypothetical protein
VAENFANRVTIYVFSLESLNFEHFQTIHCTGVAALALSHSIEKEDETIFLALASYHDDGWQTNSLVYRKGSDEVNFKFVQRLSTQGAHDAEMINYKGETFLFFSEDRNETSAMIKSQLFVLDEGGLFKIVQSIDTDGAHAAELFEAADKNLYLAIANFGDRHLARINTYSTLWRWEQTARNFILVRAIDSHGATDFEHWYVDGFDYLALCNEGDHRESIIYQLVV